jgi:hypothetical protein
MELLMIDSTIVRAHQHSAGAQKSRPAIHRSLAWRIKQQDSCCSRWIGQSGSLATDRMRGARHYAGFGADERHASAVGVGGQRL